MLERKEDTKAFVSQFILGCWLELNLRLTNFRGLEKGRGCDPVLDWVSGRRLYTSSLVCTIDQMDTLKLTNPVLKVKRYCKGQGDPNSTGWSGQLNPGKGGGQTIDPGVAAMKN